MLRIVFAQSWCAIDEDGSRYLLSDFAGGLHLLVLAHADNRVAGLKVQTLGMSVFWGGGGPWGSGGFKGADEGASICKVLGGGG